MNASIGAGELLCYNAQHKLLICLECKYAIQKHAVDSHLLRHKIYREERQQLLSAISELELPEPDDVRFPTEPCEPVDGLPIINGYKCTAKGDCGSLYASVKRMRRHWSESHGVTDLPEGYASAVLMQTFFRGTKVRYVEVLRTSIPSDKAQRHQSSNSVILPRLNTQPAISDSSSGLDLDLEKLRYFYHFMTTTSHTLPGGGQNPVKYWQTDVVPQALNLRWLMFGLLSISASHLAALSEDKDVESIHEGRSIEFCHGFLAGWSKMKNACLDKSDTAEIMAMGARMTCLQRLCIWTSDSSAPESISLQSFVMTLRGCTNPDSIRISMVDDDDIPMMNASRQSPTHLTSSDTAIRTDIARGVVLAHFSNLPYHMAEKLGRPNAPIDFMAVMSAIGALIDCCGQVYDADDAGIAWMGLEEWLERVSGRFTELLVTEKSPAALIVFAQWLLLVAMAERFCWFLRGLVMKMLRLVRAELEEHRTFRGFLKQLMGWALESL